MQRRIIISKGKKYLVNVVGWDESSGWQEDELANFYDTASITIGFYTASYLVGAVTCSATESAIKSYISLGYGDSQNTSSFNEIIYNSSNASFKSGSIQNVSALSSASESLSNINASFFSASIYDLVLTLTNIAESETVINLSFLSASFISLIQFASGSIPNNETPSFNLSFFSASIFDYVIPSPLQLESTSSLISSIRSSFCSGSITNY